MLALVGNQSRDVILVDEVIEVMVGFEDDAAAATAIAAAGAAFGTVSFMNKGYASGAAVAGLRVDFDFVNKQNEKARRLPRRKNERLGEALVGCGLDFGNDVHPLALQVKCHCAIDQGEQSPIAAHANVLAGGVDGAGLARQNAAYCDNFATEPLDPKSLGITVAPVSAAPLTFLMCHNYALISLILTTVSSCR
jgi:hypothetical protein